MLNVTTFHQKYSAFLKRFGLKPEQVIVGAGGACMVYGLRELINDIDVAVPPGIFTVLVRRFGEKTIDVYETTGMRKARIVTVGDIDVHVLEEDCQFTVIDNIGVYTLEQLLKQKKLMNREKDQKDIQAIEQLIKKKPKQYE